MSIAHTTMEKGICIRKSGTGYFITARIETLPTEATPVNGRWEKEFINVTRVGARNPKMNGASRKQIHCPFIYVDWLNYSFSWTLTHIVKHQTPEYWKAKADLPRSTQLQANAGLPQHPRDAYTYLQLFLTKFTNLYPERDEVSHCALLKIMN